jgi:hypothetical protein
MMVKQKYSQQRAGSITLNGIEIIPENYFIKLKTDKSQWANLLLRLKT